MPCERPSLYSRKIWDENLIKEFMPISKFELIFQQWKASLPERDKGKGAVQRNFEELFDSLKAEGMEFEEAYNLMPKAIKAHYPNAGHVKNAYRKWKYLNKWDSEKDLEEQWRQDIDNAGQLAFFNIYPVATKSTPQQPEEEKEPAVFGSMTAEEYRIQREYAEEWPRVDTSEIEKRLNDEYDPMNEVDYLFGAKTSGNSK